MGAEHEDLARCTVPPRTAARPPRWARVLLGSCLAAFPALWVQYLAGDTVIHLVFAESAADGRFFEYNPGELCSGETSPGYMLLLAVAHVLVGANWLVLLVKGLGLVCWYALLYFVFRVARTLLVGQHEGWSWAVVSAVGLMPGSVANAVMGMENVVFALALWLWLWAALHKQWFSRARSATGEMGFGALLGLSAWLRPEALPFAVAAILTRVWSLRGKPSLGPSLWCSCGLGLGLLPLWAFTQATLGHSPYGAGVARAAVYADLWLGQLPVSFKFGARLLIYACLSLPALVSIAECARALWSGNRVTGEHSHLFTSLGVQLLVFALLFSTVFPSVHLARYTLFLWPMLALHAARGLRLCQQRLGERGFALGSLVLASALALVYGFEVRARLQTARGYTLREVQDAPKSRARYTDELLSSLNEEARRDVVVALIEVQLRYFVDSRVTVRSLNGLLDERMTRFSHAGELDTVGYLKDRGVGYLLEYPDYLSTQRFSYAELKALPLGGRLRIDDVGFERLSGPATRVHQRLPKASGGND